MIKKRQQSVDLRRILFTVTIILAAMLFTSSCKIYKPAYYFKDITRDTTISGFISDDLEIKIQPNDLLAISISSLSAEEDLLYNSKPGASGAETKSGTQVTLDGNIYLHKLGRIAVAGLTRKQLKAKLEQDLLPFLKDPIVTVSFANHRVTVLGDGTSKIVDMPDEKITLLEVMANSNGVTANSQLNNIMVIREANNSKQVKHLNLQDPSIFTSPWYYLQPNDIVVVKPNEEKIVAEQKKIRNQMYYTTILSGITFIFLIVDRLTR
jgi:polysaccharide export outer membrane protein